MIKITMSSYCNIVTMTPSSVMRLVRVQFSWMRNPAIETQTISVSVIMFISAVKLDILAWDQSLEVI